MRLYIKRLIVISCIFAVLWVIASYSSIIEVSKSSPNHVEDINNRIDTLDRQLEAQLVESSKLLNKVKELNNRHNNEDRPKDNDLQDSIDVLNPETLSKAVLPVLVIACDRITVKRCLDNLVKFRPDKETFPIIVSQDCGHNATYHVIKSFTNEDKSISVVQQPDLSEIQLPKSMVKFRGYYKIARHYKFALNYVLSKMGYEAVIIVEDDLDISPDFFEYFLGTYPLLRKDPSIWCISAWNDNGKKALIDLDQPALLHRTDFFPGLGWMMQRESWLHLEPRWPLGFFDDWLRDPNNTKGRSCIRPEISRSYSFGKVGVSKGLYFDMHLRYMQLNMEFVHFTDIDLNYLLKTNYDKELLSKVELLPTMTAEDVMTVSMRSSEASAVKVHYSDAKSYKKVAKILGLMNDFRSGIPRTAYMGIVTCFVRGRRVYLVPSFEWTKYDRQWD